MNLINEYRKFLNHSKYGGILYIINLLLIIWITIYIIQALFSCLFYKRLTPEDYEVGYVKSYTTSQQTDDGTSGDSINYKTEVFFRVGGKEYYADLDIPIRLKTKVINAGRDANYVIGDIYYKKTDPEKVKIVALRRHVLPFAENKYICKENIDDFCEKILASYQKQDYDTLASFTYSGLEKEVTGKSVKENLEADFDYFKEKKIDLNSLQFTQFDSDCTHYVYISDGNGNGTTYYITVKDGKYKLDLRYRM